MSIEILLSNKMKTAKYNFNSYSVPSQEKYIINSITEKFYNDKKNIKILENILTPNKANHISLRILDYFQNSYAKENNIVINGSNVYTEYKLILKGYQKKCFDPFARGENIKLFKKDLSYQSYQDPLDGSPRVTDEYIITAIRQLNFFKWCIENEILDYITEHIDEIKESIKTKKKTKFRQVIMQKTVAPQLITFD
jgi:hypothetical protein